MCYKDQMKEKMLFSIIGGDSIVATSIPIYTSYFLAGISHKERMDKIDRLDKRFDLFESRIGCKKDIKSSRQ